VIVVETTYPFKATSNLPPYVRCMNQLGVLTQQQINSCVAKRLYMGLRSQDPESRIQDKGLDSYPCQPIKHFTCCS